jgi:hypothetical protein
LEKSRQKFCATSVILKTLPKVEIRPKSKNSPNLVTLLFGAQVAKNKLAILRWCVSNVEVGQHYADPSSGFKSDFSLTKTLTPNQQPILRS